MKALNDSAELFPIHHPTTVYVQSAAPWNDEGAILHTMKMPPPIGQSFGTWTVVAAGPMRAYWLCDCRCGRRELKRRTYLLNGKARRCRACANKASGPKRATHGEALKTVEYRAWVSMNSRVKSDPNYRGIKVTSEWVGPGAYQRFLAYVGRRPTPLHQLDRIDTRGDYRPGNVRWATPSEQMRNVRTNLRVTIGTETRCVAEWCDLLHLRRGLIYKRLAMGWSPERAIFAPPRKWLSQRQ